MKKHVLDKSSSPAVAGSVLGSAAGSLSGSGTGSLSGSGTGSSTGSSPAQVPVALPNLVHYLVLTLGLFSVLINFNVHVGFTNSGVIMLYGSDFLAPVMYLFCLVMFIAKWKCWSKGQRVFAALFIVFFAYAAAVSLYRFSTGYNDAQSLLIPRVNLSVLWLLLYVVLFRPSANIMLRIIKVFCLILLLISLPLALTNAPIAFRIMQSHSIRTLALLAMYPVHAASVYWQVKREEAKPLSIVLVIFHMISLIFLVTVTGSRVNAIFLLVELGLTLVLAFLTPKRLRSVVVILLTFAVGTGITLGVSQVNGRVAYGVQRVPGLNQISSLLPKTHIPTIPELETPNGTTDPEKEAENSAKDSTNARRKIWQEASADLRTNLLFGPGFRQYKITYEFVNQREVVMPPHNFILEYSLAYGLIGLSIWLLLMTQPLLVHLPALFRRKPKQNDAGLSSTSSSEMRSADGVSRAPKWLWLASALVTLMVLFGSGFVQPVLTNPAILLVLGYLIGLHHVSFAQT